MISRRAKTNLIFIIPWVSFLLFMCFFQFDAPQEKEWKTLVWENGVCIDENPAISVEITRNPDKQWFADARLGAQYDGVIRNNTEMPVFDWRIYLSLPGNQKKYDIDSSWNGDYTIENGIMTILPPSDYNREIPGLSKITFGLVLYSPASFMPETFTLEYSQEIKATVTPFYWAGWFVLFGSFVAYITTGLLNIRIASIKRKREQDRKIIEKTMELFANTIEAKDSYTRGHSMRVAYYARNLSRLMGLSDEDQQNVYFSAILHDVGKIGISDSILNKPGRLTADEMDVMRTHAEKSAEILKGFDSVPFICETLRHHHEWYNGEGYPDHLKGTEIPLFSRIICVADCFDAMTSDRCYRSKLPKEKAVEKLKTGAGTQFDPEIIPFMLTLIDNGEAPITL